MYCKNCGAENNNGTKYCAECGEQLSTNQAFKNSENTIQKNCTHNPKKGIALIAIIIAFVLIAGFSVVLFLFKGTNKNNTFNENYKEPIENYFMAFETGDGEYLQNSIPMDILQIWCDRNSENDPLFNLGTPAEFCDNHASGMHEKIYVKKFGDNISFDITYKSEQELNKDYLEKMEKELEDDFDNSFSISKGYTIDALVTLKSDMTETTESFRFEVYKINDNWCLMSIDDYDSIKALMSNLVLFNYD